MIGRPYGYFDKFLAIDCETTGLNFDHSNPDITHGHQSVSWGLVISDMKTMKPIDELYVEIKWDGVSEWHWKAEKIHGLSKQHLADNGLDAETAAETIAQFIATHFDVDDTIVCLGHNVQQFDIPFLKKLLYKYGFKFSFSHRCIDVSSIAVATLGTFTSQELFDLLEIKRGSVHNALEDTKASLTAFRIIRKMFLETYK
jgi:DNA polymerase III epsilon subunit-like protein